MITKRILVTGASGFVGKALCNTLVRCGYAVYGAVRDADRADALMCEKVAVGEIGAETDWSDALDGIDTVIHLAARVHVMKETSDNPLDAFRKVNTAGTERLARMAAQAGVRCFVFVSTVKVNGEITFERPFRDSDAPNPVDAYAISKWEAEQALQQVSQKEGLNVVILRPPLVYGPGVGANFLRLMRMIDSGIPLPFGSIKNSRSLIYIDNLVDAIIKCVEHPGAANKVFLVSDGEDLSTAELMRRLAKALGKPARLVPFPRSLLYLAGSIIGKSAEIGRLTSSLVIDSARIRNELHWVLPFTVDEGLRYTVEWYKSNEKDF